MIKKKKKKLELYNTKIIKIIWIWIVFKTKIIIHGTWDYNMFDDNSSFRSDGSLISGIMGNVKINKTIMTLYGSTFASI